MGGGQKRGRTQRKHFNQNRDNLWKHGSGAAKKSRPEDPSDSNPNPSWQPFATQNPGFEEYYKEQGIVPEDEWEAFISVLRKPLPAAFRINSSGLFFRDILSQLENDFMKSLDTETEIENEIEAIRPLPWYPGKLAWHLNYSRMQLRKNQTLERFHDFLKQENEVGNITRQEAVSMVPPLFLDVCPEHHILDMCAAPGSKTFQLLEMIHQLDKPGSLPIGLVVANDVDVQRCNLLIHQTKRMCSANLLVTNHEAQHFPTCSLTTSCPEVTKGEKEATKNILQFDRVLCDVPCSGDGTLRKAPDIWRKWNAGMGNGLHRLQVEIAMRGIALLKVGSRMVYSTCSMNPVENEAVVAEILRRSGGAVELLDVSNELPDLVRRPGLRTWKVRDRGLWLASYCDVPNYRRSVITPSMFPSGQCSKDDPIQHDRVQKGIKTVDSHVEGEKSTCLEMNHPSNSYINDEFGCNNLENTVASGGVKESAGMIRELPSKIKSAEEVDGEITVEVSSYPLDHCLRILPHDQNSGAFFIAVLKKISSLQENHTNQSNKRRWNAPVDVNGKLGGETMSETRSSEAVPEQDHCSLAEESLNSSHINDQSSVKAAKVGETLQLDDLSCQNNELEEVEPCGDGESEKGQRGKLQIQGKWKGVDPVVFFREEEIINSIRSFYGISESFSLDGRLVTRNKDANHVKRIYYISQSVHDILQLNFQVGQRLKIASLGLKTFERQTSKDGTALCSFRLSSEGLPLLLPYITKQILCALLVDFQHLLQYRVVKFADFVDANLGEKASNLMPGCCVVTLNEGNQATDKVPVDASTIAIVCWKGKTNLSIMVSQLDAQELCERLSVRFGVKKDNTLAGSTNPNCEAENINTSEDIQKIDDFGSGNDNPVEEAQH